MEQGMLNNQQREQMQGIAALGRNEDTYLAHVAPDEMIVPAQALRDNPLLKVAIEKSISNYGIDPNQFLVGNGSMDLNPLTGLPEFGFLSKVWKKAKKVVKAVAPIAVNFIPGVGPLAKAALTTVAGKASGLSTKEALLGGALSYGGSKLFGGTPGTATSKGGSFFTGGGADGIGKFGKVGDFFGNVKKGIGSLFGGPQGQMMPTSNQSGGGDITSWLNNNFNTSDRTMINGQVAIRSNDGNYYTQEQAKQMYDQQSQPQTQQQGGILDFLSRKLLPQSVEDALKGSDGTINPGSFLSRKLLPQSVEDAFQGNNSSGSMFGGNLGLMGLAGLAGKVAYDAAKERMGGMAETPKVTMDQLGRYQMAQNLGTGGSRADFDLAPAPVALNFAKGDVVEMEDYINKMTNELIESYKKDKKYRESRLLPASYIMNEEEEASSEAAKRNDPMTGLKPSYHLVKGVIRILTGESGNRIPQRKIDEIKNMVRSSVKEKQMTQMGFNMGGMAELDMREGGESEGPGTGTSDDIPAMLSDGEFVMTAKATRGAGSFNVNKTKSGIELIKGGSASRKKGVENMRELMNIFEAV